MEATGAPIAGAEVSVLGLTGAQRTDADGRFLWLPDPVAPFEVLIVLPGGQYMKPYLVTSIPGDGLVTIPVRPIVEESVSVTAGAAPSIESPPANGTTIVPKADIESRQPANLAETLENVAGVSRTAGPAQAAVPAIRGLANGRSLILIDGARVSSERRAGPGATYLDPFVSRRRRGVARSGLGRVRLGRFWRRHLRAARATSPREPRSTSRPSATTASGFPADARESR